MATDSVRLMCQQTMELFMVSYDTYICGPHKNTEMGYVK